VSAHPSSRGVRHLPVEDSRGIPLVDLVEENAMPVRTAEALVALGVLGSGIAHEINNPLTCVMANLELLARRLDSETLMDREEMQELVADAYEGADRIRRVVKLVQRVARAQTGPVAG
jgi:signal transduction histidine kinase